MPQLEQKLEPLVLDKNGVYGLIRQAAVDDHQLPDGALTDVFNWHFDRIGSISGRLGMSGLGSSVEFGSGGTKQCMGMTNSQNSTLAVFFTTNGYRWTGSAWANWMTGMTTSSKVRTVDFANRTIIVNGSYDSIKVWNGSTDGSVVTSGTPINPDQFVRDGTVITWTLRAALCEAYKSRVYLAGDPTVPSRLFYSSVISNVGNITWTPATDWVDINPGDGEGLTGLKRYSLELLVFKPNYTYRFRTSGVDPDPLIKIGTRSQESIVEGKKGLYFAADFQMGFYRYSGGYPVEISLPIIDIIQQIPYSQISNIVGWRDNDHIYWSIGSISLTGVRFPRTITYNNGVLRYTESSEIWTLYTYPADIRRGITFNNGSAVSTVVGLDNGIIATQNASSTFTDLGEPIQYRAITKWYEYGSILETKLIRQFAVMAEKGQGCEVYYQADQDGRWDRAGEVTDFIKHFNNLDLTGKRFRFMFEGKGRFDPPIIKKLIVDNAIKL